MNTQHERPSTPLHSGMRRSKCIPDVDRRRFAAPAMSPYTKCGNRQGLLDAFARS